MTNYLGTGVNKKMSNKKIAILMSTYNGECFLREQIESILHQNCSICFDLYVRDDGSTDRTQAILEEYASAGILKWYAGTNVGSACSFLKLLKKCPGYNYYAFADQDDFWKPDKLKMGIRYLEGISYPMLYCSNAELVDEKLNTLNRLVYRKEPRTDFNTLACAGGLLGCTMICNDALAKVIIDGDMPSKIVMHDFFCALVCLAIGGEILYDGEAYMKYRQHSNNVVGVSYGFINIIKDRVREIISKPSVSIADQAAEVLQLYFSEISVEKREWLLRISDYRKSFFTRFLLSISPKTKYINVNMGIKLRGAILLGNR